MGKFYLETTEKDESTNTFVRYELSATSDLSITLPTKVTNYPIEDGTELTDNVVINNRKIRIKGILTDVSQFSLPVIGSLADLFVKRDKPESSSDPVEKYIKGLEARIKNKETFKVHFSNKISEVLDCVITDFTYTRNNSHGGESFLISISLEQIRRASRAAITKEPTTEWKALLEKAKKSSSSQSSLKKPQEERVKTALEKSTISQIAIELQK